MIDPRKTAARDGVYLLRLFSSPWRLELHHHKYLACGQFADPVTVLTVYNVQAMSLMSRGGSA